jgi:hypothetical protein
MVQNSPRGLAIREKMVSRVAFAGDPNVFKRGKHNRRSVNFGRQRGRDEEEDAAVQEGGATSAVMSG